MDLIGHFRTHENGSVTEGRQVVVENVTSIKKALSSTKISSIGGEDIKLSNDMKPVKKPAAQKNDSLDAVAGHKQHKINPGDWTEF